MKQLTIDDIIPGGKNYKQFLPDLPLQVKVFPCFFILRFRLRMECRNTNFSIRWKLDLSTLSADLNEELTDFPEIYFSDKEVAIFIVAHKVYSILLSSGEIDLWGEIPTEAENLTFHPKSLSIAYTTQQKIWIKPPHNEPFLLYEENDPNVTIGKIPSRNEFGITETLFWSPDSKQLAFYRIDESEVTSYPIVHIQDPIAKVELVKYPMAGEKSEKVSIGISHLSDKHTIFLETKDKETKDFDYRESYKTCLQWSPDSQYLFLTELQRNQQKYELKYFNAYLGKLEKILYTEENSRYVEPQHSPYFINNRQLLFQSRKDNFNHLYLLNIDDGALRQLTSGKWEVTDFIGRKGNEIFFQTTLPTPLDRTIYAVRFDDEASPLRPIFTERGITNISLHPQAEYSIATHHSLENPGELLMFKDNERSYEKLWQSENPYNNYNLPKQEVGSLTIDEEEIFYRITYPDGYSQKENWPLVYYLYGGPHVQLIRNEWGSGTKGFEEMAALKGYVAFCIDPHGSDNRGEKFESAIWRNIGAVQTKDYLKALDWLLGREKRIAPDKIALYGWSFGGFMTTRMLLLHPDRFQLGVAGGAVIDWKYYEVMYTERYMQKPIENPDGYEHNSLINLLSTRLNDNQLCMIHCDNDPVVLWQHTLSFLKSCNQLGIDVDYYVFPGHQHNIIGQERTHLMQKVFNKIESRLSLHQ